MIADILAFDPAKAIAPDKANDVLGLDLPTGEFHAVGGLITARPRRLERPERAAEDRDR